MASTASNLHNGQGGQNNETGEADSVETLLHDLKTTNTRPLWAEMARYNPPKPNPKSTPFIWRYDEVRPYLLRAGNLVSEKQAERRVLMLVNPSMSK